MRASAEHKTGLRREARQQRGSGIEYNASRKNSASPCRQGSAADAVCWFDDREKPARFGELRGDLRRHFGDRPAEQNHIIRRAWPMALGSGPLDYADRGDSVLNQGRMGAAGE